MKIHRMAQVAFVALSLLMGFTRACFAETGTVSVVFTKGGFIVDVGGGQGVLAFRGKKYPFTVSSMSLGFSIGASTSRFAGRALNLRRPGDLAGSYVVAGAGGALAAGAGACSCRTPTAASYSSVVPGSALKCRPPWAV
jgi:hypothetical protein